MITRIGPAAAIIIFILLVVYIIFGVIQACGFHDSIYNSMWRDLSPQKPRNKISQKKRRKRQRRKLS